MSSWPGIRNDTADVGEGLLSAIGVSYRVDEELRRRFCLGTKVLQSGILSTEFQHPVLGSYVIFNDGSGNLKSINLSTGGVVTLTTGLAAGIRGVFARVNGKVYFNNDYNRMQVIERPDTTCTFAGLLPPIAGIGSPTQTTGLIDIGVHLWRYRYLNSRTGYISDPSVAISVTVASVATFTFTNPGSLPSDTKIDSIIYEMTTAGGTTYYRAATLASTFSSSTLSIADASLIQLQQSQVYGDFGQQPPPDFAQMCENRGRLFGWGAAVATAQVTWTNGSNVGAVVSGVLCNNADSWAGRLVQIGTIATSWVATSINATFITLKVGQNFTGTTGTYTTNVYSPVPDTLYWSRPGLPESWKPLDWARRVLTGQSDTPSGLWSFYNDVYLFGQRSIRRFTYTNDPASGMLVNSLTDMGLWNQQCLIECNGNLYGWGRSGAWCIQATDPDHISRPIDDSVAALMDTTQFANFHAVYDPRERVIQWFFVIVGQTQPTYSMALDVDRATWSLRQYRQTITASTQCVSGIQPLRALLSDGNGYSWFLFDNQFDCLPTTMSSGIVTATSGATTSIVPVSQTLDTTTGVYGAVLYRPNTSEAVLIQSNTALQMNLASPFATAPANGETLYIGSVPWSIQTMWWSGKGQQYKDRPAYLNMQFMPGSGTQLFTVQVFLDFSTTPYQFTTGATDTYPDGVVVPNGPTITIMGNGGLAKDGFISIPMPSDWARVLSATLTTTTPISQIRLLAFYFSEQPHDQNTQLVEGE